MRLFEKKKQEKIKQLYGEGKSLKQIAAELDIDLSHVKYLVRKSKFLKIWFTDEEIEDIRRKIESEKKEQSKFQIQLREKVGIQH